MLTYVPVAGQHDDARMCIAIALTAVRLGANVANHTEVLQLDKQTSDDGKQVLSGAKVKDRLTGLLLLHVYNCINYSCAQYRHTVNSSIRF